MIGFGMHSNVMLCFMVQVLQDPPLCSSTIVSCRGGLVAILVVNGWNQLMFGRVDGVDGGLGEDTKYLRV
jgi:hypothetical protein